MAEGDHHEKKARFRCHRVRPGKTLPRTKQVVIRVLRIGIRDACPTFYGSFPVTKSSVVRAVIDLRTYRSIPNCVLGGVLEWI